MAVIKHMVTTTRAIFTGSPAVGVVAMSVMITEDYVNRECFAPTIRQSHLTSSNAVMDSL